MESLLRAGHQKQETTIDDCRCANCCRIDTLCPDMSWPGLCIWSGSGAYQHDHCVVRCCSADYIFSAEWSYSVVDGFLISQMGLPLAAIWLLGKVQDLKFAIQDWMYG